MAYSAEQRDIINRIIRRGKQRGATKAQIKAALETGAVESNFRNLNYGDADSKGWRQERQRYYKNPTNVDASIDRFYNEAKGMRGSSGSIAARVQRPAAQYRGRYAQNSRLAETLLRKGGGAKGKAKSTATTKPATVGRDAALKEYLAQRGKPGALRDLARGLKGDAEPSITRKPKRRSQPGRGNERGKDFGKRFGLDHTSGYRDSAHNAEVGGVPNSAHTRKDQKGRSLADDYVGSAKARKRAAREAKRRGAKQVLEHDAGSGIHLHIQWR